MTSGDLGSKRERSDEGGAKSSSQGMLEKADTGTSGGQMVALHARAKGLSGQTWLMRCVSLQFTIGKSIFVGLVCFCSVDQCLMLFK